LKIAKKFVLIGFVTFSDIVLFVISAPILLTNTIAREKQKGRLKDSLKRIFIKNT